MQKTRTYNMEDMKRLFGSWDLRVFIIISTLLQICLIVWTYQRKRSSSRPVGRIMWLAAYMAAQFAATLSLGGIFHLNMNPNECQDSSKEQYLLALWSPFILLHLGGHSNMTAFSLADNEFWLSDVLRFINHEVTALVICILSFTERQFRYLSIILLVIGTIKFGERIFALKRGSMKELRSSTFKDVNPGLKVQDLVHIASRQRRANRGGDIALRLDRPIPIDNGRDRAIRLDVHSREDDVKTWCAAYQSFNKYKGLFVDAIFMYTKSDRVDEGTRLADMEIDDAFNIVETELNFAHDHFYTKTSLTHTIRGWIIRILSLTSITIVTPLFVHINKHEFQEADVWITYGLLIAALIFEVWGFLESLASNHTIVQVGFRNGRQWRLLEAIIRGLRNFARIIKGIRRPKPNFNIGQFNVLRYCYFDSKSSIGFKRLLEFLELKELWDNYHYTDYVSSDDDSHRQRKNRIINRVRTRLEEEEGESKIFSTLISQGVLSRMDEIELGANIPKDFEECILSWHIATHLCFENVDEPPVPLQDAKFLSDYMLYLLTVHPSTVSSVATTELTSYRKACAASIQLYTDFKEKLTNGTGKEVYYQLGVINDITEGENREGPIFLLLDGYAIAERLMGLANQQLENGGNNGWELLFQLWVDVVSYAANHCKGNRHAEQLGTGGQFLTYVWLFMVHFHLDSRYKLD